MTRNDASHIHISFSRRAWYVWLGRAAWVAWLILWLEIAIGSYRETEFFAARLSMRIWMASLLLGGLVYVWGRRRRAAAPEQGGGDSPNADH